MFTKRVTLFTLLGFKVQVDFSWIFLAVLITWTLAQGLFPASYEELSAATYWRMGIAGMIGVLFSIVFHELSHSVVARHYGIPIKGITLFIFGGVAEMEEEPPNPKSEFLMAIAGPIASYALAAGFHAAVVAGTAASLPTAALGVLQYLAVINTILATFNLIPAFPLDGGRAFRAAVWYWKGDFAAATRLAANIGNIFGITLMGLGALNIIAGNFIGGMWWFLIGLFLRAAANASHMQALITRVLQGEPVRRFMTADVVTVPPDLPVDRVVEDYVYRYHHELFPVVTRGRLAGYVAAKQIKDVPKEIWAEVLAEEIMVPCSAENCIGPDDDALKALSIMRRSESGRLMVVEGGNLVGVVALKDLLEFFALKMDLEDLK